MDMTENFFSILNLWKASTFNCTLGSRHLFLYGVGGATTKISCLANPRCQSSFIRIKTVSFSVQKRSHRLAHICTNLKIFRENFALPTKFNPGAGFPVLISLVKSVNDKNVPRESRGHLNRSRGPNRSRDGGPSGDTGGHRGDSDVLRAAIGTGTLGTRDRPPSGPLTASPRCPETPRRDSKRRHRGDAQDAPRGAGVTGRPWPQRRREGRFWKAPWPLTLVYLISRLGVGDGRRCRDAMSAAGSAFTSPGISILLEVMVAARGVARPRRGLCARSAAGGALARI